MMQLASWKNIGEVEKCNNHVHENKGKRIRAQK